MSKLLELTEQRFGCLVAKHLTRDSHGKTDWECLCDCGNTTIVLTSNLTRKKRPTKSCGCKMFDRFHGISKTRFYSIWCGMKQRCTNENDSVFKYYGAIGIAYDKDWDTFEGFYNDMFLSYVEGFSLERINVHKNYCKDNCCWIPLKDQQKNKRMYSSNSVGVPCVMRFNNKGIDSLKARVQDPCTGKRVVKTLSLAKYSEEDALATLEDWVKEKHKLFGYGESHGS